jgi:hypothetical protein
MDVSAIRALIENARSYGLKRPALTAGAIQIKGGKKGDLVVRKRLPDGQFKHQGTIVKSEFKGAYYTEQETKDILARIEASPAHALKEIGKETGTCCCCGRVLRDPVSVAAGIGPDCAKSWGLK